MDFRGTRVGDWKGIGRPLLLEPCWMNEFCSRLVREPQGKDQGGPGLPMYKQCSLDTTWWASETSVFWEPAGILLLSMLQALSVASCQFRSWVRVLTLEIKLPQFSSCFHLLPANYFPSLHIITISHCTTRTPHFSPIPAFSTFGHCSPLLPLTTEFYGYPKERNNWEQSIHFNWFATPPTQLFCKELN